MPTLLKRCLYCGQLYKPININQKYCFSCDEERMNLFRKSRVYKTCECCRRTFLSLNGEKKCDFCKGVFK